VTEESELQEAVRRHWNRRASTFDDAGHHGIHSPEQRDAWLARLRPWAGADPIDVLDVGCGTGFLSLLLAALGHRVVGIDIAEEMLARAREKAAGAGQEVTLRLADAARPPFSDESFDLVVERHLIWTVPEPMAALRRWTRILRPAGRLVLVEGHWAGAAEPDYEPIRDRLPLYGGRPAAELRSLVVEAGYGEVAVEALDDPVLWGEPVTRERYALIASR
jgi:ubiquinone/menaquinone biosynthesis C-methylase UbiE